MRKAKPEIAFVAAFLALLVLPLTVALGLAVLGFAASRDLIWKEAGWGLLTVLLVWVAFLIAALLTFIARRIRRTERS